MYKSKKIRSPRLICFNTHGYTGVEQVTSLCKQLKYLKILPGQNFIKFNNLMYRKIKIEQKSIKEIFEILNLNLKQKNGRVWAGLFKYAIKKDIKKYNKMKHFEKFKLEALKNSAKDIIDYKFNYIKSYFYTMYKEKYNESYVFSYYSGNSCLAFEKKEIENKIYILNVFCPIEFWLSNISNLRFWNTKESISFWLVNNLYLLYFSKNFKNYQNLNIKNFLENSLKKNSINLKKLGIKKDMHNVDEIGLSNFQQKRVDNWKNNATIIDKIYDGFGLYKLAKNFEKWSNDFIKEPEIINLLIEYKKFFQSSTTTNLDWTDPISEKIIEILKDKKKPKDNVNLSFKFYHEYYWGDSFDHKNIIRKKQINYLGSLENQIEIPDSIYHLKVACTYLNDVLNYFKFSGYSTIKLNNSIIYNKLKNYIEFSNDESLRRLLKVINEKIKSQP
jgi:hypothetical protein